MVQSHEKISNELCGRSEVTCIVYRKLANGLFRVATAYEGVTSERILTSAIPRSNRT